MFGFALAICGFAVIGDHVIFYSDIEDQILQYQSQGLAIDNEDDMRDIQI